jgi:hypothetical protein
VFKSPLNGGSLPAALIPPNDCQAGSHLTPTSQSSLHSLTVNWACQSQTCFTTGGLPPISSSWRQVLWDSRPVFFISQPNTCGYSPYVTSSLTRGWVCRLQLLLVLASAVILRSESRGTRDQILLSQMREEPGPRIYIPQVLGSLFIASYVSQGYGGGIQTRLHTGKLTTVNLVSLITPQHGPRRKHSFSIVASMFSMGSCLSAKASPSNGRVYLLNKNLFPNNECCFVVCFEVATQQRLHTLQYFNVHIDFYLQWMYMKPTEICKVTKSYLKYTDYFLCALFDIGDGSRKFLRNVSKLLPECMNSHARRYKPSSELQISWCTKHLRTATVSRTRLEPSTSWLRI